MPRPTIRTISQAANVSNCTVSRALRGDTRLRPETRERIQKLARSMGYEINAYVSSWMTHVRAAKTNIPLQGCIAYLNYHKTNLPLPTWDTPRRQFEGAVARAGELGYRVEQIAVYRDSLTADRIRQILHTRAIKGVLLPVSGDLAEIALSFDSLACVAIGHRVLHPPIHFASADHHTMITEACVRVAELGYRRTGLLFPADLDQRLELRPSSAYLGWQHRLPKSSRIPPLLYQAEVPEAELVAWCRRHRIDSLLCFESRSGERTPRTILGGHFRIPRDLAIITLDWHPKLEGIAGIDQRHEMIGAAAVDVLVHMLNNNVYGIPESQHVTLVESVWRPGASAPPRT